MSDKPLYMLRLRLSTPRLFALGRTKRLPLHQVDLGYLIHCQLFSLFGKDSPVPFSVQEWQNKERHGRALTVLAYSSRSQEELREHADTFADPGVHAICDWGSFCAKRMPSVWPKGKILGFRVKSCPVVRLGRDVLCQKEGEKVKKGAEVDAFLARGWAASGGRALDRETARREFPISREKVYREWLEEQLARRGGARLLEASLTSFQRERLLRRTQGDERKARPCERPAAIFEGKLEISDSAAFGELLRRGIGRHRAFGFGMLLLQPA